jgi:hypothetical protein
MMFQSVTCNALNSDAMIEAQTSKVMQTLVRILGPSASNYTLSTMSPLAPNAIPATMAMPKTDAFTAAVDQTMVTFNGVVSKMAASSMDLVASTMSRVVVSAKEFASTNHQNDAFIAMGVCFLLVAMMAVGWWCLNNNNNNNKPSVAVVDMDGENGEEMMAAIFSDSDSDDETVTDDESDEEEKDEETPVQKKKKTNKKKKKKTNKKKKVAFAEELVSGSAKVTDVYNRVAYAKYQATKHYTKTEMCGFAEEFDQEQMAWYGKHRRLAVAIARAAEKRGHAWEVDSAITKSFTMRYEINDTHLGSQSSYRKVINYSAFRDQMLEDYDKEKGLDWYKAGSKWVCRKREGMVTQMKDGHVVRRSCRERKQRKLDS